MAFKRRYLPTSSKIDNEFTDITAALKYLQGMITDLQKGSTIRQTYSVDKGFTRWHIVNEYSNGMVECNGYMANPWWTVHGDHPARSLAIVRLPVIFVNTDYVVTYASRTNSSNQDLGHFICDYGGIFETETYRVTTDSFPVCICEHYTGWNYRVIGWKDTSN